MRQTSPAKQAQYAGSEFKTETQVADDQHHVLPGYQVKRLKDELETFPMEGKMIEFSGPVPSYTEVNGAGGDAVHTERNHNEVRRRQVVYTHRHVYGRGRSKCGVAVRRTV